MASHILLYFFFSFRTKKDPYEIQLQNITWSIHFCLLIQAYYFRISIHKLDQLDLTHVTGTP